MNAKAQASGSFAIITVILLASTLSPARSTALSSAVPRPSNIWAPYGPYADKLQFNYYFSEGDEFNAFLAGELDLTDLQLSGTDPRLNIINENYDLEGTIVPDIRIFGIQFNQHNLTGPGIINTWASWGCNFQHATSPCGIEIREAFAHLIDRPRWVNDGLLQGGATPLADPAPLTKIPGPSSPTTQNSWDTLSGQTVQGHLHPETIDAFNIAPDPGGFPTIGSPDFCAARDHFIAASIGLKDNDLDCVIDSDSPGLPKITSHPIRFIIRSEPRLSLGNGLRNAIDEVFGTTVTSPCYSFVCVELPFTAPPIGLVDDWDVYTYGWSLAGPFADHLQALYGSENASDQCGGPQNGFPYNNGFICIPNLDLHINTALQTNDIALYRTEIIAALDEFGKHAAEIPVYTPTLGSLGLRDMAGKVDRRGVGFSNFWSTLNGRNNGTYTPFGQAYTFGGGTNTLRWGQQFGTSTLNPFTSYSASELAVLGEIYDALFTASPVEPWNVFCWMCNTYALTVDTNGNTNILLKLRQNLRWHDGTIITADDVKFSLLNLRDTGAPLGYGALELIDATALSPTTLEIVMNGINIAHLYDLSTVPILPSHLWQLPGDTTYGSVGKVDPAKIDYSFDPLASGILVGSGPFICRSIFPIDLGRVGTGCAKDPYGIRAGQSLDAGAIIILERYDRTAEQGNVDPFLQYMRSHNIAWATGPGTAAHSGQFQEFSWADKYDNATVTIRDLASVAACFGASNPAGCPDYSYWLKPQFHPSTPDTVSSELAIVASHLDDTWVFPFSWSGDQSSQPGLVLLNIVSFMP